MLAILFTLVLWAVVFYVLWWVLGKLALGEPWDKVLTVVLVIATIFVIVGVLTGSIAPFPFLRSI